MKNKYEYAYEINIDKELNAETEKELDTILRFYGFAFDKFDHEVKGKRGERSNDYITRYYANEFYFIDLSYIKPNSNFVFNTPRVETISVYTIKEEK